MLFRQGRPSWIPGGSVNKMHGELLAPHLLWQGFCAFPDGLGLQAPFALTNTERAWNPNKAQPVSTRNNCWDIDWISGKIPSVKGWSGCPGKWWGHQCWKCSKNVYMWCLRKWLSGGLGRSRLRVGLDDLRGLLQPKGFYDSIY